MPDLSVLGQYGLVGVMLALVALTASAVYFLFKFACNHVEHNTAAIAENIRVLEKLATLIETKLNS